MKSGAVKDGYNMSERKFLLGGYVQEKCFRLGLDYIDIQLIDYTIDFFEKATVKKTIDDKEYFLITSKKITDDLYFLQINSRTVKDRMKKLVKKGVFEYYLDKEKGNYPYYKPGEILVDICPERKKSKIDTLIRSNGIGYADKPHTLTRSNSIDYAAETCNKDRIVNNSEFNNRDVKNSCDKKIIKKPYGSGKNVYLTDTEYQSLKEIFQNYEMVINDFSNRLIVYTNEEYKNHYSDILKLNSVNNPT